MTLVISPSYLVFMKVFPFCMQIRYKKGMEMLKIFKSYTSKTSLIDDFMYYENRQKILQEEKARLLIKTYESPFLVPVLDPPRKLNFLLDLPASEDDKITKQKNLSVPEKNVTAPAEHLSLDENPQHIIDEKSGGDILKIGSLSINPKQARSKPPLEGSTAAAGSKLVDVVTVGSLPVKVNGFSNSSGFLTVGTIPLDPRALQMDEAGVSSKNGSEKG